MDETPVTAAAFRRFVRETGYVTVAERPLDPAEYPDADPDLLVPGALVFRKTAGPVNLDDYRNWWQYVPDANWKHPGGKGTTINGRDRHPVVHVACEDAEAYAAWAGKELPTEAEWEYAARGGLEGAAFAWGDEHFPDGKPQANTWQGEFPWQNLRLDGHEGTSPVGEFPPNGYGLYDMTGNVWEWTSDWYVPRHTRRRREPVLRPDQPTSDLARRELQPRPTRRTHPSPCDQGRVSPLRSELLPPVPPGSATAADDRHLDGASRLSLHRAPTRCLPRADLGSDCPQPGGLDRHREHEHDDHDTERDDRVRSVEPDGEDERHRSRGEPLPGDPPDHAEAHQREPAEEDRHAQPERPAPGLRERVERMLEGLLRRDGVEDDPEHDRVVEEREDVARERARVPPGTPVVAHARRRSP